MKELTLREAIEALKAGKKVRLNQRNSTPFCLNEEGLFKFDGQEAEEGIMINLGYLNCLCNCISDFESIINRKCFVLVENPILDDMEKNYLGSIIKPFKEKYTAMTITKTATKFHTAYICITLIEKGKEDYCHEEIALPYFDRDKMYKGMELDREYTLEELEL